MHRFTLWWLEKDDNAIIDHSIFDENQEAKNSKDFFGKFEILIGNSVQSIEIRDTSKRLKTNIQFSENITFSLLPHPNNPDLELWKLFMPMEQVLTLENKAPFWSCRSIYDRC